MEYPWKVTWTKRAKAAASLVGQCNYVIDVGGGRGHLKEVLKPKRYVSIDLDKWTEETVVADLNYGCPILEPCDTIFCLGVIEYIENPDQFLTELHKYGDDMVISYRLKSEGGMPRQNEFTFKEFEDTLLWNHWHIVEYKELSSLERVYLVWTLFTPSD